MRYRSMKNIKYILLLATMFFTATSCMNNFKEPEFENPPFGNNSIGEPNTRIIDLKSKYKSVVLDNGCSEIKEEVIIEGVVVADDRTGNIYKQLFINDGSGAIIVSVNTAGLYTYLPVGQRVRLNCKGLCIGGYGKFAQLGVETVHETYGRQIGRMGMFDFQERVRLIGAPDFTQKELVPMVVTEEYLADDDNKDLTPVYAELRGVSFKEANGVKTFAPESEQVSATNTAVNRTVYVGGEKIIFRLSTYSKFAAEIIPQGKLNIRGVLTRYNNDWQFMLCSLDDIEFVE